MPPRKSTPPVKLTAELIARTALDLLNEVGLDGLTMRALARRLNVQAPALYWHVKNKQELLDAMATIMYADTVGGIEAPRRGVEWDEWAADWAKRLRRTMLRYRDGARVFAGTAVTDPLVFRTVELALATLQDGGFELRTAARAYPVLLHYTVGFTIEEQSRLGVDYGDENPYGDGVLEARIDRERFPLTAAVLADLFDPDTDRGFEDGLRVVLEGIRRVGLGG
ncbi:TetR/AcrR family transcriptional regulator C-terminal domain-containing protein [Nocardia pseudobrasiliensis]|uniref:TetR/AcrR family transcriptional regulator C-terminal domain-containing protein n=1 Tax=Nocardia pseudobrasiliensis TaxID=45979 RepID=UPI000837A78E|nr:TetR/AcrR family transcriptional regulator C-terminal domain-containing protein [Nocardia pseudobrasiliensis]